MGEKMDKDTTATLSVLKELQSVNRFVLKRLNQIVLKKEPPPAASQDTESCCSQEENSEEIATLKCQVNALSTRVQILEAKDEETEPVLNRLCLMVENLQKKVESLEKQQSASEQQSTYSQNKIETVEPVVDLEATGDTKAVMPCDKPLSETHTLQPKTVSALPIANTATSPVPHDKAVASVQPQQREQHMQPAQRLALADTSTPMKLAMTELSTDAMLKPAMARSQQVKPMQLGRTSVGYRLGDGTEPSTVVEHRPQTGDVSVIRQTTRTFLSNNNHYEIMAAEQRILAQLDPRQKDLGGAHTVFIVDISESIAENGGWQQASCFFNTYLDELERVKDRMAEEEHVALVVFGHEVKILQYLTNNYIRLKELFGQVFLGGPSPMLGGLTLGISAACTSKLHRVFVNSFMIKTRIIIITDGRPTEHLLKEGPDYINQSADEETRSLISGTIIDHERSPIDVIVVPVGNADMEFLEMLNIIDSVNLAKPSEARMLARRTMIVSHLTSGILVLDNIEDDDKPYAVQLIAERSKYVLDRGGRNRFNETPNPNLPPTGSRVERGPDWRWDNQDCHGPGTVIGHEMDMVWVHWDVPCNENVYNYGLDGYDLLLIDTYRQPENGFPRIGCIVRPGKDWKGDTSFKESGVVFAQTGNQVQVRWSGGTRGLYSCGKDGKYEVEPSPQRTIHLERVRQPVMSTGSDWPGLDLAMPGGSEDFPGIESLIKQFEDLDRLIDPSLQLRDSNRDEYQPATQSPAIQKKNKKKNKNA